MIKRFTFLKNLTILIIGTGTAQAISVIMLPIMQKFYSPEDFGTLNLFISLITLFTTFSTLKLEYAIVLPKYDVEARSIVSVTATGVVIGSLLSLIVILIFGSFLLPGISVSEKKTIIFVVPFLVFFTGLYEALSYWFTRKERYKTIALGKVVQNTSTESFRLLFFFIGTTGGLVIGRLFGYTISFFFLVREYFKEISLTKINKAEIINVLKKYKEFPLFTMPTVFISSFTSYIFGFLLIRFYGNNTMGIISVANQYISLPLGIIAGSFSQIFYKKISLIDDKKELFRIYFKFSGGLASLSILLIIFVSLIPDSLPSRIFGLSWDGLMPYVRLTVIWQGIAFVASSLSFIYTRLRKQRIMLFFALLQLILVYGSIAVSHALYFEAYCTFLAYVLVQAGYYAITIIAALYFIKKTDL